MVPEERAGPCFTWEGTWGGTEVQRQLCLCRPGCTDPVAGAAVEVISRTTVALDCLGPIKATRAGVMEGVWTSRFAGPGMATKGMLGGTPTPAGS